jgi:hypothetical protein
MSELSGTAAVGIETVEWLDAGGGNLTVRVTGRWRRRRPASTGQVTLVIDSEGRRHRFPAMPEPPSLGGAGPGMWRLSFSVPGSLAPGLGGQTWLSLGTVTVPLPAPGVAGPERDRVSAQPPGPEPAGSEPPNAEPPNAEPPNAEPPRAVEVPSAAPPPAPEPELRVEELERRLADAQADRDQLTASLAEGERTRRIAEQRAHAEQALRRDLARQLASREHEAQRAREAMGDLAAAEDRIRTLERRLRDARRRGDEAEQLAAAATARTRAERAPRPVAPVSAREAEAARVRLERRLRVHQAETGERVPAEPSFRSAHMAPASPAARRVEPQPRADEPERREAESEAGQVGAKAPLASPESPATAPPGLVDTLSRELDARAAGDATLRARLVAAETRLAARVLLDQRTTETLRRLRAELDGLRTGLERERARRRAAEARAAKLEREAGAREQAERRAARLERELGGQRERSRDAYDAIGELRGALERLSDPTPGPAPPTGQQTPGGPAGAPTETGPATGAGPLQVDRLSDALTRLRQSVAPPDAPAEPPAVSLTTGGRTLDAAFRRLVKSDAGAAGELLMDLLGLQRAAFPHPIAYDLVLGPGRGCVRVTVGEGPPSVELHGAARTREEVDFRVKGEPARIARLLTAHGIWRRLGPRVARVRGRRDGLAALQALLSLPLDLGTLQAAGVRLRPAGVLALVAAMVQPAWTAGERFVIAHRDPEGQIVYLAVRDGRSLEVARTAPAGRVATTIAGPAEALVTVLIGGEASEAEISGDQGPLTSLRTWVKHAQSG